MELNDDKVKIIAYYLPQYYPFKENERIEKERLYSSISCMLLLLI